MPTESQKSPRLYLVTSLPRHTSLTGFWTISRHSSAWRSICLECLILQCAVVCSVFVCSAKCPWACLCESACTWAYASEDNLRRIRRQPHVLFCLSSSTSHDLPQRYLSLSYRSCIVFPVGIQWSPLHQLVWPAVAFCFRFSCTVVVLHSFCLFLDRIIHWHRTHQIG